MQEFTPTLIKAMQEFTPALKALQESTPLSTPCSSQRGSSTCPRIVLESREFITKVLESKGELFIKAQGEIVVILVMLVYLRYLLLDHISIIWVTLSRMETTRKSSTTR